MNRHTYLWSAGGATVSASLTADFISHLRQVITSSGDDIEIGGLLLGRRTSEDEITIEDFDLLPSEHRRGVTYTLSQADRRKLGQHLRLRHQGLETVGTFRTHLRQGLYMDQYDYELMQTTFAGANDVMLLIRPADWAAGMFVWEQGDIQRQKSYREFAFDATKLPLTVGETGEEAMVPAPAWRIPSISPIVIKAALLAATIGLVAMLAHYSVGRRSAVATPAVVVRPAPSTSDAVERPVDPDVAQWKADEMHVKLPESEAATRPSPFENNRGEREIASAGLSIGRGVQASPLPSLQLASNLPASLPGQVALKPEPPQLVSTVSVQPAQPGAFSRSINRIPILNLLHRSKYKAGERFAPARPVRQVKPRLPLDWTEANGRPAPVDVKVWVDENGRVTRAQPLSGNSETITELASNAAMKWTFEPARLGDRPVSSEVVMHFRFTPRQVN